MHSFAQTKSTQTSLGPVLVKNVFHRSLIIINCENEKYKFCCFLWHKFWIYFNQTHNFKQKNQFRKMLAIKI